MGNRQVPSVEVGNSKMYVDNQGNLHKTPEKIKLMYHNETEVILSEFEKKCRKDNITFDQTELNQLVHNIVSLARERYKVIQSPATSTKEVYISHWLRETLQEEYLKKSLRHVDGTDLYTQAISHFFTLLPLEKLIEINEKMLSLDNTGKAELFSSQSLPITDLETAFIALTDARNKLAKSQSFESMVAMHISISGIPIETYQSFINQIDETILLINKKELHSVSSSKHSNSIFELPCDICSLASFPFETLNQVYSFVEKEYPLLSAFGKKIVISEGQQSYTIYNKEDDNFLVFINKNLNIRHKSVDLLHELGHVVSFIEKFKAETDPLAEGKYQAEYNAAKIQHTLIKKVSHELYWAYLTEILILFWKVLFEIELYSNPNQNIGALYAKTYNKCFSGCNHMQNDLYLIDELLITRPLRALPHAVAHFQVLQENFI